MFITIVACGMNYHENKLVRDGGDAKNSGVVIVYVPVSFREDLIDHFFFFFFCRGGKGKKDRSMSPFSFALPFSIHFFF